MLAVSRSPVLAVALVLLFVGSVPPSQAQILISFGTEEMSYGWTFPDGEFPGAFIEDAEGDLALTVGPQPVPAGGVPLHAAADITGVRIDEVDGELLRIRIEVADIDPQAMQVENGLGVLAGVRYRIAFNLSGHGYSIPASFGLQCQPNAVGVCEPITDPAFVVYATLYRTGAQGSEEVGDLPTRVLPDADAVEILLPRWAFERPGEGRHPLAGDAITGFGVDAYAGPCMTLAPGVTPAVCARRADSAPDAPDAGVFYTLAVDSHGSRIGLDAPRPEAPARDGVPQADSGGGPLRPRDVLLDVDAGATVRVPLVLTNGLDRKALIQPAVTVRSAHAVVPVVPATVSVPAGDARVFTIDVALGAADGADGPLILEVNVRALGTVMETGDRLIVHVRPVPALSPDNARLYLHTVGEDFIGLAEHSTILTFSEGMLSTLADDALDNGYGSTMSWSCLCSDSVRDWPAASMNARDVHLDPEVPAVLHIEGEAVVPGSLVIEGAVLYGEATVAVGDRGFDVPQGAFTLDLPLQVSEDAASLPAGGSFFLSIQSYFSPGAAVPLGELLGILQPIDPRLKTEGATWLELPLVAAADRYGGAAHLVVDLARGHDALRYVNPGKTVLWNVTVLNQGDAADVVSVDAANDAGWSVRLEPGRRYQIGPGESVTLGVLATAPAGAAEGATAKVNVTVASDAAEGASARLGVTAVVTAGVAIDEPMFEADNETAAAVQVERKEKGSPAPSLALVLAGLVAAAVGRARADRTRAGRTR